MSEKVTYYRAAPKIEAEPAPKESSPAKTEEEISWLEKTFGPSAITLLSQNIQNKLDLDKDPKRKYTIAELLDDDQKKLVVDLVRNKRLSPDYKPKYYDDGSEMVSIDYPDYGDSEAGVSLAALLGTLKGRDGVTAEDEAAVVDRYGGFPGINKYANAAVMAPVLGWDIFSDPTVNTALTLGGFLAKVDKDGNVSIPGDYYDAEKFASGSGSKAAPYAAARDLLQHAGLFELEGDPDSQPIKIHGDVGPLYPSIPTPSPRPKSKKKTKKRD